MRSRMTYYMVGKRTGHVAVIHGPTTYEVCAEDAKWWSIRGWTCWIEEAARV